MKTSSLLRALSLAVSLACVAATAQAHSFRLGELRIGHPYARATVPGQPTGGGFLRIENPGNAGDKLVSAKADVSARVELHEMKMEGDVMKMREVSAIDVPAGKAVDLKPGGLHIMFIGLKAPLKEGSQFPLVLRFEKAGEVTVTVDVEAAGATHGAK